MSYGSSSYRFGEYRRTPHYDDYSTSSYRYPYGSSNGYSSTGYSNASSKLTLLDKYSRNGGYNSSSILPSKSELSRYPITSRYSTSRTGRAESKANDIVRPSMRSRNASMPRNSSTYKKEPTREQSLPRGRERDSDRDYPELSPCRPTRKLSPEPSSRYTSSSRQLSPIKTSRTAVPEFREIKSTYNKSSKTRNGTGANLARSPSITNGNISPPTMVEARRTIHNYQLEEKFSDLKLNSPSFNHNRTSNNNNKDYDESTESSRSSTGSKRDEILQNGVDRISSSSSSRDFTDANAGLVGLKNIGNTCFMNSILQCLSNTKLLRDYCLKRTYEKDINKTSSPMKGKLVEAFSDIIRQLWHSSSSAPLSTFGFKSQIQKFSKRFSGYEQQDSQEFLRCLIEGLHEDVNQIPRKHKEAIPNFDSLCDESKAKKTWDFYLSKDKSYIVDLFMGQLKSSLTCAECKHVSTTFDPFWDLSLPMPKSSYQDTDVQRCLDIFTKEEILDGDERPTCDECKARRRMTKKFTIYKFPKILVIHLKRFSEGQRFRQKLSTRVEFPHKLQITKSVSTSSASFNLYAVSNHSGSCYGGHYTAYCKNPETDKWHSFSDSLVSSMNRSAVQSKEAYVLFYENISSTRSHL